MSALMNAELLRLVSRRTVWLLVLLVVAAAAIQSLLLASRVAPLTQADHAQAQASYEMELQWYEEELRNCERSAEGCDWLADYDPDLSNHLRQVWSFDEFLRVQIDSGTPAVLLVLIVALVVVVTGSDFTSGALATQLTFTPHRISLLGAKTIAGLVAGLGLSVVALVTGIVVSTLVFLSTRGASEIWISRDHLAFGGRYLATVAAMSLLAALITMLIGSPVLTLIVIAVLGIISYAIQTSYEPALWLTRLMPSSNLQAMYTGEYVDYVWIRSIEAQVQRTIATFDTAVLYHVVLIILLAFVAGWRFQRRDLVI